MRSGIGWLCGYVARPQEPDIRVCELVEASLPEAVTQRATTLAIKSSMSATGTTIAITIPHVGHSIGMGVVVLTVLMRTRVRDSHGRTFYTLVCTVFA